ncbi:unnamed protein product [Aspergillus oryzae]|nr:unnamed protein product [Aspergillus oryzae]
MRGHRPHAGLDASRASTGVVWCTERATEHGYAENPSEWANLGQGAPEADDEIEGSFPRPTSIPITSAAREYGPTAGIKPLRAAVARLYNEHYRQGKESQYTWENVCIVPGGRAGLIRIAAILGNSYLSFPIPDYSAYSEMLTLFKNVRAGSLATTTPPTVTAQLSVVLRMWRMSTKTVGQDSQAIDAFLMLTLTDVLLIDGLTKRFRLPGWRIAWIVGPKEFVDALGSAGSYLDGGANVPFQEAAIPMLEPSLVRAEMKALQYHFREKRDFVVKRLTEIGFRIKDVPQATFYIWLDLTALEPPLPAEANISDGLNFFNALLSEKVIVVPGIFFDLNPAKRRDLFDSPCHHFVRLSYGPKMDVLKKGLDGIERVIRRARGEALKAQWEDESVRRLVVEGLARSAIVAYQARPRDTAADGDTFADYPMLLIDRDRPPWGSVEHPGWSSPASPDLPDLPYRTVIQELPNLIEAKAVSLAPPDPFLTATRSFDPSSPGAEQSIPDTRVVDILRRPVSMGLREYLQHLASLNVIQPPEIGAEFIALYERARFSSRELHETEFRDLMHIFAGLLRGMKSLDTHIMDDIYAEGSRGDSESVIGPSDEEGETDTMDFHDDSEAFSRGRSNSLQPSNASTWEGRSTYAASGNQSYRSPVWSRNVDPHRLATPRTPSMRSLRRVQSNASGSSGGSVIRLVDTHGPTDLPYAINFNRT